MYDELETCLSSTKMFSNVVIPSMNESGSLFRHSKVGLGLVVPDHDSPKGLMRCKGIFILLLIKGEDYHATIPSECSYLFILTTL